MRRLIRLLLLTALFLRAPFVPVAAFDLATASLEPLPKAHLEELRAKAVKGDAEAQRNLGYLYATGNGMPKDPAEAVKWYRMAAEQGNAAAQSNLGVMYANGNVVAKDQMEAVKWFRKAAERGSIELVLVLGLNPGERAVRIGHMHLINVPIQVSY